MGTTKRKRGGEDRGLERDELIAAVCEYLCQGLRPAQIRDRLKEEHGVEITRNDVHRMIESAAKRGWLRFTPTPDFDTEQQLKEAYPWLHDVSAVSTRTHEGVCHRAAKMLLELLQKHYAGGEVHIGLTGGIALRTVTSRFADLLIEPQQDLPKQIVFHALVAGFDLKDPSTDPNAFSTYFVGEPPPVVEVGFVGLFTPAMAPPDLREKLLEQPDIVKSYGHRPDLDVVVTSASCWDDDHSILRKYLTEAGEREALDDAECIGDMLWQPIGADGPIEPTNGIRTMTVMELGDLRQHVADKKHALLVAGPCARCHTPKTAIVRAILGQEERLLTHLAVDVRCSRALLAGR